MSAQAEVPGSVAPMQGPVVLFDGVCNLCNGAVQFVLDHERGPVLRFAALQSDMARKLLSGCDAPSSLSSMTSSRGGDTQDVGPSTIVLVEGARVFVRSTAALRIARHLRWPWRILYGFIVIPAFARDAAYRWIAGRRYAWFGKSETCRVPTPELRGRFLD